MGVGSSSMYHRRLFMLPPVITTPPGTNTMSQKSWKENFYARTCFPFSIVPVGSYAGLFPFQYPFALA